MVRISLEVFLCAHQGGYAVQYYHVTQTVEDADRDPDLILHQLLISLGINLDGLYAHSTSWRYEPGEMVLTYLVWCTPEHLARLPCERMDCCAHQEVSQAAGPLRPRPAVIGREHVLLHGLRHLRYLVDLGEPELLKTLDPCTRNEFFARMPSALAGRIEHVAPPSLWSLLVLCWVIFWGVLVGGSAMAEPIAVRDFRDKLVMLDRPAQRIVCLIESALSGLYMLGAADAVVGIPSNVYDASVRPYYAAMDERIRDHVLPAPGNWEFVNIESVLALRPDLVVIWANQRETIAALEEHGVPVYAVRIGSFADVFREIHDLGDLTGTQSRSVELTAWVRTELERLRAASVPIAQRPRVYFMWAQGTLHTSGRPSTVQELIELAGGINVAEGLAQEHTVVNIETVLAWGPEVIIMWANGRQSPADIMGQPVWQDLPAARHRRVYELPSVFFCDLWTLKFVHAVRLVHHWLFHKPLDEARSKRELLLTLYGTQRGARIPIEE